MGKREEIEYLMNMDKDELINELMQKYYEVEYYKDRIEVLSKQKDYYKEIILEMRKENE